MNWQRKGLAALFCASMLALSTIAAAASPETVHTELWTDRIYVNGVFVGFQNEQGRPVDAVYYNGTIYIPIRTAGEWMGCTVSWNQEQQTIELTSGGTPHITASSELPDSTEEELAHYGEQVENGVDLTLRPDIAVKLDGEEQTFQNVNGEPVYPVVLENVTYLPVRNVGELCGLEVAWVPKARADSYQLVILYTPLTQEQKTNVKQYQSEVKTLYETLNTEVEEYLSRQNSMDKETAMAHLDTMTEYVNHMMSLSPGVPVLEEEAKALAKIASYLIEPQYSSGAITGDQFRLEQGTQVADLNSRVFFEEQLATLSGAIENVDCIIEAIGLS